MTHESLTESTSVVLDEAIQKCREEIMAGRSSNALEFAEAVSHLADAFNELEED